MSDCKRDGNKARKKKLKKASVRKKEHRRVKRKGVVRIFKQQLFYDIIVFVTYHKFIFIIISSHLTPSHFQSCAYTMSL